MSEFSIHAYSARAYTAEEIISFSGSPRTHLADMDREMEFHQNVSHVQVSNLTQAEFDRFVRDYGDSFRSIYFFQNTKVKDLSALSVLQNVEYLLFYNMRSAKALWDMSGNGNLKGILISDCRKMAHDLSPLIAAPALEELLLFGTAERKCTVRSLEPLKSCKTLKRAMPECRPEDRAFFPEEFSHLEILKY